MRITYISNSRIPTEKAYGVSIVKTCEALARKGAEVRLLIPRVRNLTGNDLFSYYKIKKNFSVQHIPTIDAVKLGWKYSFLINQISFGVAVFFSYKGNGKEDVVITRDEMSGWLLSLTGHRVFYDIHGFPESRLWMWKILLKHITGIFATNEWKAEQCRKALHIPKEKIIIARNGFDPKIFFVNESTLVLRKRLHLPIDKPIVLYVGHFYDWKGVYVLLETAKQFQIKPAFVFVGGAPWDIVSFKKKAEGFSNVLVLGNKPHNEVPLYLKSADVLVLPNSAAQGKDPRLQIYSQKDTSPIKMFEYMASGVPIVASDLPSIKEILNEKNAVLVEPDNPKDLKKGIEKILNDKELANAISKQALRDVKEYTWEKRAENIFEFIKRVK